MGVQKGKHLQKDMLLQILVAFSILANCQAYRDDSPNYKWSPNYFGALGKSAPVIYSSRLSTPRRVGLTHNTRAIHTSISWSKWNMDEIIGLKFHLPYYHMYI